MKTIRSLVGNTPTVFARHFKDARLFFKLEGSNPTQSLKDRTASTILEHLAFEGRLAEGKTLIDASSGSFGCALAHFGRLYGAPVEVVVNSKASSAHIQFIESCGAKITRHGDVTREGYEYVCGVVREYPERYIHVDQLNTELSPLAHFQNTGPEILRDTPNVRLIVTSLGSGATALGVSTYLYSQHHPAQVFVSTAQPGRKITGTYLEGEDYRAPNIQRLEREHLLLGQHAVAYNEAVEAARTLNNMGLLVGPQTGGVYLAALEAISRHDIEGDVVCISGDSAFKALDKLTENLST